MPTPLPPWVFLEAIATVPLAVLVTDNQGTVRYVNQAFERLTLYPADEAIGRTPRILKSGRQDPDFYAQLWATIRAGRAWTAEVMNRRRDGTLYRARHIIVPIPGPAGRPSHFIGFREDVTALRAAEGRQRLEVVGRLTSGIAHDLNTLLTIILGNTELPSRALAKAALNVAESAAELVTCMLAFARRQPLAAKPTDVDALPARMRAMLVRTLGGRIAIELVRNGATWPAFASPLQPESAVLNLCVNARDAMPEGGRLTIETANLRLGPEDPAAARDAPAEHHVMIAVSDTGTGIWHRARPRSMVYGFVEQSKGRLQIRSEPGRGTTVTLGLPRARAPAEQAARHRGAGPRPSCWSWTIRGCARPRRRGPAPSATRCSPPLTPPRRWRRCGSPVAGTRPALLAKPCRHQHLATALRDVLETTAPSA